MRKSPLIVALIIWACSHFTGVSEMFFLEWNDIAPAFEVLQLLFLWGIFAYIRYLYISRHSDFSKRHIQISIVYFIIGFVLLLLVWPGNWEWDSIFCLNEAQYYRLFPWQHYLTNSFYIIYLKTLPFPAGVIFFQLLLAALISGYCVATVARIYSIKKYYILVLPMLAPPLFAYILSGFRMGLYSYLELGLVIQLLDLYKSKSVSNAQMLALCLNGIIVASWRTEAILYILFIPIILLFISRKGVLSVRKLMFVSVVIIVGILLSNSYNNKLNDPQGTNGYNRYAITAMVEPASKLTMAALDNGDKAELDLMGKVFKLEYIDQHRDLSGERIFWDGGIRDGYTKDDFYSFVEGYRRLALKYPVVTIKSMGRVFVDTLGLPRKDGSIAQRINIEWDIKNDENWNKMIKAPLRMPWNDKLRTSTLKTIRGRGYLAVLTWNTVIPFLMGLASLIMMLKSRQWFLVSLLCMVLIKVPIVFITASAPYLMYYLSVCLVSSFFFVAIAVKTYESKRARVLYNV